MTVKELITELSKYDGDLEVTTTHVTREGMEDARYKIAYIAEESLSDNLIITLKDDPIEQRPSECKHNMGSLCALDMKESKLFGGGYWVRCCDIYDDPDYVCPDYEPKVKTDCE